MVLTPPAESWTRVQGESGTVRRVWSDPLNARDATHSSSLWRVSGVVPDPTQAEVAGTATMSPRATWSSGPGRSHPVLLFHSLMVMPTVCAALRLNVQLVWPAWAEPTTRYQIAVWIVALEPAGWLMTACVQPDGAVTVVTLLPTSTQATTRLLSLMPLDSVMAWLETALELLTWLDWTRVYVTATALAS